MNPQLKNWDNFCRYHTGDWQASRFKYSSEGEVIQSWLAITHLHLSKEGDQIYHQDQLISTDHETEIKTYGPYHKPLANALFLKNAFCWGNKILEPESAFVFEVGFRIKKRRSLCYFKYDPIGKLQYISTGIEYLQTDDSNLYQKSAKDEQSFNNNWQKITPDWIVSEPKEAIWQPLADLHKSYQNLQLNDGISVIFPLTINKEKTFFIGVDWQENPDLLQRGIGYYESSSFSYFTLENFKINIVGVKA